MLIRWFKGSSKIATWVATSYELPLLIASDINKQKCLLSKAEKLLCDKSALYLYLN